MEKPTGGGRQKGRKNNAVKKSAKTALGEKDDDIDRRGRPTRFTDNQLRWMKEANKLHDKKVAPFNNQSKDDPDLRSWIDEKWKQFEGAFPDDLDGTDDSDGETERVFKERYRNRRYYLKRKANVPISAPALADLIHSRTLSGYQKFLEAHRIEVNAEVRAKTTKGTPDSERVGSFQKTMGERWQKLPEAVKSKWNDIAKKAVDDCPTDVYKNQTKLLEVLTTLLQTSQGFDTNQSGDSAHILVSTFRNADGLLRNNILTVPGLAAGAPSIDGIVNEIKSHLLPKWDNYCLNAIPDTIAELESAKMAMNEKDGAAPPLLKDSEDEEEEDNLTPAVVRAILIKHFEQLWAFSQSDSNTTVPWADIVEEPGRFVTSHFLPQSIPISDPRRIDRSHLFPLRSAILKHQAVLPLEPFVRFVDMAHPAAALTSQRATGQSDVIDNTTPIRSLEGSGSPTAHADSTLPSPLHSESGVPNEHEDKSEHTTRPRALSPTLLNGSQRGQLDEEGDSTDDDDDRRIVDPKDAENASVFMPLKVPEVIPLASSRPSPPNVEVAPSAQQDVDHGTAPSSRLCTPETGLALDEGHGQGAVKEIVVPIPHTARGQKRNPTAQAKGKRVRSTSPVDSTTSGASRNNRAKKVKADAPAPPPVADAPQEGSDTTKVKRIRRKTEKAQNSGLRMYSKN